MTEPIQYTMKIERKIVDKLGLRLYDKVAAVVAELIANSYDADAEEVNIELPLGKALAVKRDGAVDEKGYTIRVSDNGHGMTPEEANDFYLKVAKDRRDDPNQGNTSREKGRYVMGRKGIGKLAPFGVCKTIEVRSAGGTKTKDGYRVTHFRLDYDEIVADTSEDDPNYHPTPLKDDKTWEQNRGTTITLRNFLPRIVPNAESFQRQLSYRFLPLPDFGIKIIDTKTEGTAQPFDIVPGQVELMEDTKVLVDDRPVQTSDGKELPIKGWVGMAKQSYKNTEFAGVRIYARGKIAAITRDFEIASGFMGEFVARSYLVGELHADWLDDEEDLIQTHRQDILWSSDLGQDFSKWGQEILKEVAKKGREPRRTLVKEKFIQASGLKEAAMERYEDPELQKAVLDLGEQIGSFASEDELDDDEYVAGLREIILAVAPHKLLVETFREIELMAVDGKIDLQQLLKLFNTINIAQVASYGQIISEQLKVIDKFEELIRADGLTEAIYQEILEDAPWLIDPRWEPITSDQSLDTFRSAFHSWYEKTYGEEIITTTNGILHPTKRPDFIFLHVDNKLTVLEIKPPAHVFGNDDWVRLNRYDDALEKFFADYPDYLRDFPEKFQIILVANQVSITDTSYKKAFDHLKDAGKLVWKKWEEMLRDTKRFHNKFLTERTRQSTTPISTPGTPDADKA